MCERAHVELPLALFVLGRQISGATFLFPNFCREKKPILAAFAADFGDGGLAVALEGDHVARGDRGVVFQARQVVQAGGPGGDQLHGLRTGEAKGLAQDGVEAEALNREFDLAALPLRGRDVRKRDDRGLDADAPGLLQPGELDSHGGQAEDPGKLPLDPDVPHPFPANAKGQQGPQIVPVARRAVEGLQPQDREIFVREEVRFLHPGRQEERGAPFAVRLPAVEDHPAAGKPPRVLNRSRLLRRSQKRGGGDDVRPVTATGQIVDSFQ